MYRGSLDHIKEYIMIDVGATIKKNQKIRIFSDLFTPIEL